MPPVFLTHPWILSGLAALAVPVIIHLLLRRKKKRLRFSTLRFFARQDQQSSRRRKLRNWLLLALRLLIIALLVTAFARPFLPEGGASSGARQRRQAIFVLDRSASMLATGAEGQRWTRAKGFVQKALGGLEANDRAALVVCSTHTEVLSGFVPPESLARLVTDLQPAYGTSSLGEGLQQAVRVAANGDGDATTTLYIVSDLQRSACENIGGYPVPQDLDVQLLCTGDVYSPNLSITDLQLETRAGARPHLAVSSFSDEDGPKGTVELAIDRRPVFSSPLSLRAGVSTNIDLDLPHLEPGWHEATASLQAKDAFELDNTRYAAFFIPEPVHALIVESRKDARVFEQVSFFLTAALDPSQDSTNAVQSDFILAQAAPEDLARRLSGSGGQPRYDVVLQPGLKDIPHEAAQALTQFVRAGGGVLMFVGEGISANHYNNEFHTLLPARLESLEVAADPAAGWRIGEYKTNTAAFAVFNEPDSGDLAIPQFFKRYSVTPVPGAVSLAFFEDGVPLVIAAVVGGGQVALINSSADTSWNDWPKHKSFVPWLHGLGKQVAPKSGHGPAVTAGNLLAGDDMEIEIGAGAAKTQFVLRCPGGQKLNLAADDLGRLRNPGLTVPGIYSLQSRDGREIQRMAVNLPPKESDLSAWKPLDFQQQLARIPASGRSQGAVLFSSKPGQKEFWKLLLLVALGSLLVETIVANRSGAP